jgi:hypothetical protein
MRNLCSTSVIKMNKQEQLFKTYVCSKELFTDGKTVFRRTLATNFINLISFPKCRENSQKALYNSLLCFLNQEKPK